MTSQHPPMRPNSNIPLNLSDNRNKTTDIITVTGDSVKVNIMLMISRWLPNKRVLLNMDCDLKRKRHYLITRIQRLSPPPLTVS